MIRNAILATVALLGLCSCNLINDDSDCVESVNIFQFHYDRNLKFACASDREVKSVTFMAFDAKTGTLAYADRLVRDHAEGEPELKVRIEPGEYDVLVWAGNYDQHYQVPTPKVGSSKLTDFTCALAAPAGTKLESLFHCLERVTLGYAAESAPNYHHLTLTKDTNRVRVLLQHLHGEPVNASDFIFEIADNNSLLDYNNTLHPLTEQVTYSPIFVHSGSTDINTNPRNDEVGGRAQTTAAVAMAEFDINRLFDDGGTKIVVKRKSDNATVIDLPLVRYALMMKGYDWADMDPQEYLDRQDEYNLTFFLDSDNKWISASIIVNDWKVIIKETDIN